MAMEVSDVDRRQEPMEGETNQLDKRADSNGQATNPRIIIDASYIHGMQKDGAPLRTMYEQGGRIVITDTLVYERLTSCPNQWPATKSRLVACRDAIEVWEHVSKMCKVELEENRPYGDPLNRDRTEGLRFELANDLQYEPDDLEEIIEKARQEREGSNIPELFRNFAELNKEFKEEITAKIKDKTPHDKEVVQTCYGAINDPKSIRSMVDIIRSAMKNDMDILLNAKDINEKWVIWHYCKSLLTIFCDCGRRGEHAFRRISDKYKKRLYNIIHDLDYLTLLAFADAIASRETKGEQFYYRRWMFGDASKPLIRSYEKEQITHQFRQMSKIAIYVTEQLDGYTCALDSWSQGVLNIQDSGTLPTSVFISYETERHIEFFHGPTWKHTVEILTGYSAEELRAFGGVVFVDPETLNTLFEPLA